MNATIDFQGIAERANLRALVEAELGPPNSSRKWHCPFHDDQNPSLGLTPDGRRYRCWSGGCGETGTALDWIMRRDQVSIVEAARRLDPGYHAADRPARPKPAPRAENPKPQGDPGWQAGADAIIRRAEETLWSEAGTDARRWLRWRGIAEATARKFRLGFLEEDVRSEPLAVLAKEDGRPRPITAVRGVVFPWLSPGEEYRGGRSMGPGGRWLGANVRRLMPDVFQGLPKAIGKLCALTGSTRGYAYPWPDLLPSQQGPPALIVEGEMDALLGTQSLGHLAQVCTVGGADQKPHDSALAMLDGCPIWLLGLDHDDAGASGVNRWRDRSPEKCRRVLLPTKDLGEFVQAGGDLQAWLSGELVRLGLSPGRQPAVRPLEGLHR